MLSRRALIWSGVAIGGGLVYGYSMRQLDDGDAAAKFARVGKPAMPLNAWLKIAPNGDITCAIHRAEMGQGVTTSLAMLLIEELDADWASVRFEFAPVDRDYFNFGMLLNGRPFGDPEASWLAGTGTWAMRQLFHAIGLSMTISSTSVVDGWDTLRPAGAIARQMLVAAAARRWNVAPDQLRTEAGFVIDDAGGREAGYGELAEAAAAETPTDRPALKPRSAHRLIGTNPPRLDTAPKITGEARFAIDVRPEGLLHAAIAHSPVAGSRVAAFDTNGADTLPGVRAVLLAGKPGEERAVAVVAEDTWQAMQAARTLRITPAPIEGEAVDTERLDARLAALLNEAEPVTFRDDGDAAGELARHDDAIEATYAVPFLAHACMEPMNCTAHFTGTALTIWAPTQAHTIARDIGAAISGLEPDAVTVHMTFMGGGFGRRAEMDFVEQAVSVACQLPGQPVQVTWSREQDMRHDAFRPAALCRIRGALDDGVMSAWDYHLVTQSVVASYETRTPTPRGGEAESDGSVATSIDPGIYPLAHLRVRYTPARLHVPAGYWRSVSHSWNAFFIESFVDELASADGIPPLALRRRALADQPRLLAALDAVAERAGDADGIGYAVTQSHGTVVAHAVEVIAEGGLFKRVVRVISAIDCGPAIHPDNVVAQVESSVVDGLSAALHGRVDLRDGVVVQDNFDRYRRLRLADCPAIDVIVLDSAATRPGGVGEPAVPGVAPALTNAIFAATGRRIRRLPILG